MEGHQKAPRVLSARVPRKAPQVRARLLRALVLVACALLAILPAGAADLTGSVDHGVLGAGETFDYVISLAGGDGRDPPDVSPLTRDFDIVGRDRRSRFEEVDGHRVQVNQWVMTLAPKRTGILTVPGLTVNGQTSKPLKVEVVPALPSAAPGDEALFVQVEAGDAKPYAQSLVPVVVRIYDGVGLRGGRLGQLSADGAAFTPEGGQRVYVRTIGKRRYGIIEQSYLMQPQKSGTVEIAPVTVVATLPGQPGASSLPNLLGNNPSALLDLKDVTLHSQPVKVEVMPRPAAAEGWFLPAREVTLSQSWSAPGKAQDKTPEARGKSSPATGPVAGQVGVALTRTLRLEARGASPNQLPPLPIAEVEGLNQYEEASHSDRVTIEGAASAELVKTISIVPSRPGRVTLPAIAVGWWNTEKARPERAELPAVTMDVAPAPGTAVAAIPSPTKPTATSATPEPQAALEPPVPASSLTAFLKTLMALLRGPLLGPALAAMGLLAAALWGWRALLRRRARRAAAAAAPTQGIQPRTAPRHAGSRAAAYATAEAAEQALVRACRKADAQTAHTALLAWLRLSTQGGGERFHAPRMASAVRDLSAALYSAEAASWQGRDLLRAFQAEKRGRRRKGRHAQRARIAPLYPTA